MSKKLGKKKQPKLDNKKFFDELFKDSTTLSEEEDKKVTKEWEDFKASLAINTGTPNRRSWDIPYKSSDLSKYYTLFLAYGAQYKNLNSTKKIKRFSKKYAYFDWFYYDKLITCGLSKKKRKELYMYQETLDNEMMTMYSEPAFKQVADNNKNNIYRFLLDTLKSQPKSYARMLENWFIYCALEFYYYGVATDDSTKTQVDKLLELANLLSNNKYKEASEVYAEYSHYFWD